MDFDIHEQVSDEYEGYDEARGMRYRAQLMDLFAASPKAQEIDLAHTSEWSVPFIDYGMGYLGLTPAQMTPEDVDEVLFELFPRKVSLETSDATEVVTELRAFWMFLGA